MRQPGRTAMQLLPTAIAIARLNDRLRQYGLGRRITLTYGISFEALTQDNDPYGEHDCATLHVGAHDVIWKIDYYDPTMSSGSADPASEAKTHRVMTIMLASEY